MSIAQKNVWTNVSEGSGVHICPYVFEKFGPSNSLLLEYKEGRCAILSPPPEPDRNLIEHAGSKGSIDSIVVSNLGHTAGYKDWQKAFPEARLYAASDCIPLLKRLKPDDLFHPVTELECRLGVELIEAPGTRTGSVLMRSQLGERCVVFVDELLINLEEPIKPWFMRLMFAITGTKTGISINKVFRQFLVSDRQRLVDAVLSILEDDPVCIPAHGDPIVDINDLERIRRLLSRS